MTSDAILRRPDSARTPNNLIAIAFILAALGLLFRPGLAATRELRTLRVGVLAVSVAAVIDNLRGLGVLAFPGPDVEPVGFAVLIACLGTLAAWRALGNAERLVAIDKELSIARQIQSAILPRDMPRLPGLTVAARYQPMTAVAGDFYEFLEVDDERLGVLVADVSGHGVGVREIEQNGLPLGLMEVARYEQLEQPLDGGDRFLLYTDGLVEATNAAGEFFGLERVKAAIGLGAARTPDAVADGLLAALSAWSGQPAGDDLTIVLVDLDFTR